MLTLVPTIVRMPRSGIREIMDMAAAMSDVIHLEIGEPSFPTPQHITEAAFESARAGYTRYTSNAGFLSLREKIAAKLERVNGLRVSPDGVVVTPGAICALANAVAAVVEPGDEVLIPDPCWPNYNMMVELRQGKVKRFALDPATGFLPDIDDIEAQVTPRTKAIMINSPSNPTGGVFPGDLIRAIVTLARRHDLFIISDEVYEEIIFEGEHVSPMLFDSDRVIGIYGFSKTYAMTGWRLGYAVAAEPVAAVIAKLLEASVSCASAISQKAAEAALDGPQDSVPFMRDAYRRRRDLAVDLALGLGMSFVRPRGAFYLMVDVSSRGMDATSFARSLLMEACVAVTPGDTFGPAGRDYVRLSLAGPDEQIEEGIRRLAAFLRA